MKCRSFFFALSTKLLGVFLILQTFSLNVLNAHGQTRPNIIVIMADDMRYSDLAYMPRLNRLVVDNGTLFSSFVVTSPLCCPSRSSLLRGQFVHSHGVLGNTPPLGGFARFNAIGNESETLGVWLSRAGYRTALLGKYLNGYVEGSTISPKYVPPGWSDWFVGLGKAPYTGFNYAINTNGSIKKFGDSKSDYLTDVLSEKSVNIISSQKGSKTPLFMMIDVFGPHLPAVPAPRHKGTMHGVSFNTAVRNGVEADVSDKPLHIQRRLAVSGPAFNKMRGQFYKRIESLQSVDELVQHVVEALRREDLIGQTYLFFVSDNGFMLGEHRVVLEKKVPYEESVRVPLIAMGPNWGAGVVHDELTSMVDLTATLVEMSGAVTPYTLEGWSLLPLLSVDPNRGPWLRRCALIEYDSRSGQEPFEGGKAAITARPNPRLLVPSWRALRSQRNVYVEYATGDKELYDLLADPSELNNLASSAAPDQVSQYSSVLNDFMTCTGESCLALAQDARCQ